MILDAKKKLQIIKHYKLEVVVPTRNKDVRNTKL